MLKVGDVLDEGAEQIEILATAATTGGELVRARVTVATGRPAPPEHSHPRQEERFNVEQGTLGYVLGDRRLEAGPGEVVVVPPATNHTFWNAGDGPLSVVTEVRPALDFEGFLETLHVLIRDGRLAAGGRRANPLLMAVVARAYRREWRLTKLSPVARAALAVVAMIGRLAGYSAHYSVDGGSKDKSPAAPAAV
jgi:mannose-6-phosphate isomerase-like protein (cupin superfamily)